jgi:hypothetical protein
LGSRENLMSDIPDAQLFALGISVLAAWFMGFYFGKLAGRQETEARHKLQRQALKAAQRRNNPR